MQICNYTCNCRYLVVIIYVHIPLASYQHARKGRGGVHRALFRVGALPNLKWNRRRPHARGTVPTRSRFQGQVYRTLWQHRIEAIMVRVRRLC